MRGWAIWMMLLFGAPAQAQDLLEPLPETQTVAAPPVPDGWDTVPGTHVVVHGPPSEGKLLVYLANRASEQVPGLARELGVGIGGKIHVYVADSDATFHDIQPGRTPEWADGTAWPEAGAIFLRTPRARLDAAKPLERVLTHELVHVLIGRAFVPHTPPRWLQEGLAQVYAGEDGVATSEALAAGLAHRGSPYGLDQLDRAFPASAQGAALAYAQSADLVRFLRDHHGDDAMRSLIRAMAEGRGIDSALYIATQRTFDEVNVDWTTSLQRRFPQWGWTTVGPELASVALGGLAVAALVTARVRTRRRMQAMKEAEAVSAAAIGAWLTTPDPSDGRWTVPGVH
jgi:hypothetical protein